MRKIFQGRRVVMVICTSWKHDPVRPDVEIKSSPIFAKTCPKSGDNICYLTKNVFLNSQKVTKYLGYFSKNIYFQVLSKIAQSGHTGCIPTLPWSIQYI